MDYCRYHKTSVSSLYKAFQPCSGNPTGIPPPYWTLLQPRSRSTASNISSMPYHLSSIATFLCVYSEIIRLKPSVYKFMPGTFARSEII